MWEVYLEELGVAGAVGGRVEDGVSVVEDILRAECFIKVSPAVLDEGYPPLGGEILDKLRGKVGAAASK